MITMNSPSGVMIEVFEAFTYWYGSGMIAKLVML